MDQVISNFADIAAGIVGAVIHSIPEADTPAYFIMLGTLLLLLALLFVWLLIRLRRARLAKAAEIAFAPDVTFEDISAEAAATEPQGEPETALAARQSAKTMDETPAPEPAPQTAFEPAAQEEEQTIDAKANTGESGEAPTGGFRFFKRKPKTDVDGEEAGSPDDDVFLLGLEQEMLATRQLYLDGLITKEVYVTETRALYDKAQSRMS